MKKKISQISSLRNEYCSRSDIYTKYKWQFNKLISCSGIRPGSKEEKQLYIQDADTESRLRDIYEDDADSLSFLIGFAGIGKSTVLRNFFNFGNSVISEVRDERAIIFPMSCNGKILDDKETMEDFTNRIGSVCSFLERKIPQLQEWFSTTKGQHEFYEYINDTNPRILEHVPYDEQIYAKQYELEEKKLYYAFVKERFIFTVTKLKYYLGRKECYYNRLIVILDDVEPLPYAAQKNLIMQYVRFYECMRNVSEDYSDKKYIINMLISIRPHTYRILNTERDFKAYYVTREIIKQDMVDLHELFSKKIEYYSKDISIENKDSWDIATKMLLILSGKFNGKYGNLIKNISLRNTREALQAYSLVLSNRAWIQRNMDKNANFTIKENDYIFNNITVLRALACEHYYIYARRGLYLVPNILMNSLTENYAIINLCIINCFLCEDYEDYSYGQKFKTKEEILGYFHKVFFSRPEIENTAAQMLDYLYSEKILRKSINDTEKVEQLKEDDKLEMKSRIYLSPKGYEIDNLLKSDSVYFELCREEYYREMSEEYASQSSFELMQKGQQLEIFRDLFILLAELIEEEKKYLSYAKELDTITLYRNYFGSEVLCEKIFQGLWKSIEYSGNMHYLWEQKNDTEKKIAELKGILA